METKIGMIAAVSEALRYKGQNSNASHDEIIQHISNIASKEKDKTTKIGMIAAAAKALDYIERNPDVNEKEVIKHVMHESSDIAGKINLDPEN